MLSRIYVKELGAGLLLYAALLAVSILLLTHADLAPTGRHAIALAPMLGLTVCAAAILRQLHRLDEMQRSVQLEGLAIAAMGTALVTVGYGFLEDVGLPRVSMFAVWPLMAAFWIVGTLYANRRYRP